MLKKQYILGVDGGNTKTDFVATDTEGNVLAKVRTGTCSHEALDGYISAAAALAEGMQQIQNMCGLTAKDFSASVWGLAGVDISSQHKNMQQQIAQLGFKNFVVCNDGFLGIKAATDHGVGICSIEGTGVVTTGVDETGNCCQIGGIGEIVNDCGGGGWIARRTITAAYEAKLKNGPMFFGVEGVEKLFDISTPEQWLEKIHPQTLQYKAVMTQLVQLAFRLADLGDPAAFKIVQTVAHNAADSVLACLKQGQYPLQTEVVLAGSVWVKGNSIQMHHQFQTRLRENASHEIQCKILMYPPVLGAVYWALERINGWPDSEVQAKLQKVLAEK